MKVDIYDSRDNCIDTLKNVEGVVACKDGRLLITRKKKCKCCGHDAWFTTQVPAGQKIEVKPEVGDEGIIGTGKDVKIISRDQVQWFAGEMEKALRENDYKGGWENSTYEFLFQGIDSNLFELKAELRAKRWDKQTVPKAIKYATDIANFAMMIADYARRTMNEEN